MKYFKVKTGYKAQDFVSIDENELGTAMRAQITGKVGVFKEGSISGSLILSITPDYAKEMGWKRGYEIQQSDWEEIGERKINEYRVFLENVKVQVDKALGSGSGLKALTSSDK